MSTIITANTAKQAVDNGAYFEQAFIGQSFEDHHKTSVWQSVFEENLPAVLYIEQRHQNAVAIKNAKGYAAELENCLTNSQKKVVRQIHALSCVAFLTKGWLEAKPEWIEKVWPIWRDAYKDTPQFCDDVRSEIKIELP